MSKHIKKALKVAAIVFVGYAGFTKLATAMTAAKTVFATTLLTSLTSKGIEAVNANFGTKLTTRTPTAPRQIVYGQTRVGGTLAHIETTGTDNVILHQVIIIAGHEIDSLVKVKFGDTDLTLDGGTSVSGSTVFKATNTKYKNTENENKIDSNGTLIQLTFENGSQTAANGFLRSQLSSITADHIFKDCAYVYLKMVHDAEKFAGGIPAISFEVKGKKVYDPRSGETAFTDSTGEQIGSNPALCIRDYLSNTVYGLKATASELNDTTSAGGFNSAATTCEQQVNDIDGNAQNRYTANGFTNFSASGEGILEGLLTSMAGRLTYVNGKFNVFAGATQTPSLTITDDDLLSDISVATNPNAGDLYNTVKPVYTDASTNYTAADAPVFQSSTFLNADTPTGESTANYVKQLEIRMPFTTNPSTAQRIARIKLNEQRQTQTLEVLVSLKFMQLQPNDWVYLTNTRLSYSSKVFEVVSTQLEVIYDEDVPVVATRLVLKETANSVYSFVSNDYETEIAEGSSVSTGTFSVSSPTGLSATSVVSVDITTTKINVQASWTNATNNAIQGTEIRYGTSSGTYTGSVLVGKGETTAVIPNLNSNTTYYVVARHFSNNNIFSSYTSEVSVATGASSTAPSVPTSLAATTGNPLTVKVSWTNPSNSDLRAVKIYRHTAAITPTNDTYLVNTIAVEPGTSTSVLFGKQDGLSADTTYYFYARAINHTGLQSSFTSGVTGNFTEVEVTDIDLPDFSGYFHKEGTTTTALTNSQFNTEYGRTPLADDILIMVNTSASPKVSKAYKYSSGSFTEISNFTTGDLVVDGTLAGSKIVAASIAADRVDSSFISTLNLITTSATIGNDITIGSGNSVFKADSNGIYLGNSTFSSAPFRVTPAGALTASSAVLSGSIKTGEAITAGSGTRTVKVSGSTNTDIILSAGNATPSLAPFKVKSDGSIEITNLKLFKSDGTTKMFDSATGFTDDAFSEIATDLGTAISTYAVNKTGSSASDAQKITLTASQSITVTATKPAFMTGSNNLSGSSGATDATNQIPAKVTMVLKHSTNADLSSATTLAYLGSSETNGVTKLVSPTATASSTEYRVNFFTESEGGFAFTEAFTVINEGAVNSDFKFSISDTDTYAAGDHYFFVVIGGTAGTSTTGANNVSDSSAARGMAFSGTEFYIDSSGDAADTGEGDITAVTAGTGLSGGGTSGAVTLSLTTPALPLAGGTLTGTLTTTASAPHFITPGMLRMDHYESAWGANASRTYIQKGWTGGTGDYFQLTATGNQSNTSSSSISMTDTLGILFGRGKDTFDGTMSTEWARIDTSGTLVFTKAQSASDYLPIKIVRSGGWASYSNQLAGISATDGAGIVGNFGITYDGSQGGGAFVVSDLYDGGYGASGEVFRVNGNGAIKFANAYTFPTADGSSGQMLVTDGAGNLSFGSSGDASSLNGQPASYYATASNLDTYVNRSYVSKESATDLAVGWYTIAQNTGNRAVARFAIWDVHSGDHQSVIFYAAHHYGTDASNTLTVLDNSYFGGNPFRWIRIKDGGTYDGAALQVYIDDASNDVNVALVGDNVQSNGWEIVDFLPDATAPSLISNWSSFTEKSKVDLNLIAQGGFMTTGPIYGDGDLTQYKYWNVNNDGSGSGLDADRLDGQQASYFINTSSTQSNNIYIRGTSPTLYLRDTNGLTSFVHQNASTFHILRSNSNDATSWNTFDGTGGASGWPFTMNLTNSAHAVSFGSPNVRAATNLMWHAGNDGAGSGLDADSVDGIQGTNLLRSDVSDTYFGRYLQFGTSGGGSNTTAAFASIEGNTDSAGEGSGRLFFREHNSTTASADAYGMSLGYRGGSTSVGTARGNTWTGLSQIGNGEWGMWGHDGDGTGALIMHGPRTAATLTFNAVVDGTFSQLYVSSSSNSARWESGSSWGMRCQTSDGYIQIGPANNSYAHIYTDRSRFYFNKTVLLALGNSIWHAGNDGAGSGLDADNLDGYHWGDLRTNIDMRVGGATTAHYIHLPRGGGITFYGDTSQHHGIFSRNAGNSATDDILISSYGAVYIDLDSNNNNSSAADFVIGRHNSTSGYRFSVSGETGAVIAANNITAYGSPSDIRLKENIEVIANPIEKVQQLKGITFNYKKDGGKSTGLIAQDLEKVLPEVVYETHDIDDKDIKFKAVRYGNVVGLLVEAIKEQQETIKDLTQRINNIENKGD